MKPILFNTEMVRAILEGRKTVTRRVIKYDPKILESPFHKANPKVPDIQIIEKLCTPPYEVNDVLYVRETWKCWRAHRYEATADICFKAGGEGKTIQFQNGNTDLINRDDYDSFVNKWMSSTCPTFHPSIHMPKEAARIFLKVNDVHVERLMDICNRGTLQDHVTNITREGLQFQSVMENYQKLIDDFKQLWNSTIKKDDINTYGWDANPFVWVINFEKIEI